MASYLLGIDSGLTLTKAVVFDAGGREIGFGEARVPHVNPNPRWVERDMAAVWSACAESVRSALAGSGIGAEEIVAVAPTGHGDGVYLIDEGGAPVRPAVLSLDSRAVDVVEGWREDRVFEAALPLTGQQPFAASPAPLLAWLREHEPASFDRTRWLLTCKDWIRYRLTGQIGTDFTEASLAFSDVGTQRSSERALDLYGLRAVGSWLPPVATSSAVVGGVTEEAAAGTGLRAGTPVVAGLHDVDASAVGTGCVRPGQLAIVAGTWSINEVISAEPRTDPRWACRNFVEPGRWMNMAYSPASATNLEWFVRELCPLETERAAAVGESPFALVDREVASVWGEEARVFFHPFLYGSPHGDRASASFFGLRGWHRRGHLLRALLEGVTFNHKAHVDALRSAFAVDQARLTGGGAQSELWSQLFADVLGVPIVVTDAREAGARGAAFCAGVGVGMYGSLAEAAERAVRVVRVHEPDAARQEALAESYATFAALAAALEPVWPRVG